MKIFQVGIIGCGTIFPIHAWSINRIKSVKLAAVCDIKEGLAKARAKSCRCRYYTDYRSMLDNERLDAVHICTPHYLHKSMIIEAAKRGMNVITEKPMGLNPAEAKAEIAAAKKGGIVFSSIFQNRFNPGSQLLKSRIAEGKLGRIKSAKLVLSYHKPDSYYKKSDWKGRKSKEGGGVVIDQAIHYLDILRWLIPGPADYVEAHVANRFHSFIDVEDSAEGVIKFKSGAYVCFYLINYYSFDADPTIEFDCVRARAHLVKDSAYIGYYDGKKEKAEPKKREYIDYGDGVKDYWGYSHYNQIRDFYAALRAGRPPAVTGEDALKTQELVDAIYESSRKRRRVYL